MLGRTATGLRSSLRAEPRRTATGPRSSLRAVTARLTIEYDGTGFSGWAVQPGVRTVQGELERALATVRGEPTPLTVAGRTDAGVHALAQVASHAGEPAPARALNGLLPTDIRVLASEPAPDGFDARRDARSRTYRYRVIAARTMPVFERNRALRWRYPLDPAILDACAALLPGRHDFTAFTPTQTGHVRFERDVFRAGWEREPEGALRFTIEADSFMRNMVRVLTGTMLDAAAGRFTVDDFATLLTGRPRSEAGETAAACGLFLESVTYH